MKKRLWAVLILPLLSGCGIGAWLAGGETNLEPPAPLTPFDATLKVTPLWSLEVGAAVDKKYIKLNPLLHEGLLYVTDPQGLVRAVDAVSGRRLWEQALETPVNAGPGLGEGLILVGTRKGQVIALDRASGARRWSATVSSEVLAPPQAQGGIVVVQVVDGKVFGLAAGNGERLWLVERNEPPLSLRGTGAPLLTGGVALVGFATGKIAAIQLRDGRVVWEIPVAQPRGRSEIERLIDVDSPPLVVGRVLYAAAYQGQIVAVDLDSGRTLWSRDLSSYTEMAADGAHLYVTDERGHVHALALASGATVWKQEGLKARFVSAPAVGDKAVAVGDYQGYVHWLAREDGRFLAREQVKGGGVRAQPVALRDTLYVASQGGTVSALRIE